MSRKTTLAIKLIVLIALLILLISVALGFLGVNFLGKSVFNFGAFDVFSPWSFTQVNSGNIAQDVQSYEDVEEIEVYLRDADIKIYETDSDKVTFYDNTETSGFLLGFGDNVENTISFKNGKLVFNQGVEWSIGFNFITTTGDIVIEVPKGSKIEYNINAANSDIEFDALSSGTIDIDNVNGDIEIMQAGEELDIDTVNSNIEVYAVFEKIDIDGVNANVNCVADSSTKNISYDGVNGDLTVEILDDAEYNISLNSVSGRIDDDYDNETNNDGIDISVDNVSGNVSLEDWR